MLFICIVPAISLSIRRMYMFGGTLMKAVWPRDSVFAWSEVRVVECHYYIHDIKFQDWECKHCVVWLHSRTATLIQHDLLQTLLELNDYGSDKLLIRYWRACLSGQSSTETEFPTPLHSSDKFNSSLSQASCQQLLKIIGLAVEPMSRQLLNRHCTAAVAKLIRCVLWCIIRYERSRCEGILITDTVSAPRDTN